MTKHFENIPRSVIERASDGNIDDLEFVLRYFGGYIKQLASRTLNDEYGNKYIYVDEDICRRLETKLISSIVSGFKVKIS